MFTVGKNREHDDRADSLIGALELCFEKGMAQRPEFAKMPDDNQRKKETITGGIMNKVF